MTYQYGILGKKLCNIAICYKLYNSPSSVDPKTKIMVFLLPSF